MDFEKGFDEAAFTLEVDAIMENSINNAFNKLPQDLI